MMKILLDEKVAELRRLQRRKASAAPVQRRRAAPSAATGCLLAPPHSRYSYGPRNRSPLKWMMWLGASATQTSVSHAMSARYLVMARRAPRVAGRRPRTPACRVELVELNRWPTRYGDCMPSLSQGEELCGKAERARGAAAAVEECPGGRGEGGAAGFPRASPAVLDYRVCH